MSESANPVGVDFIRHQIQQLIDDEVMDSAELAGRIGITRSSLSSLMLGEQRFSDLSHPALRALADVLNIPMIYLLRQVGMMTPEDFVPKEYLSDKIQTVYQTMCSDPRWSGVAPSMDEWNATPLSSRIALCVMYEYTNVDFIKTPQLLDGISDKIGHLRAS